jgi:cell pole-organizing protein PopZ
MTEPTNANGHDGADPSMEEILASIRRILNEDEAPQQHAPAMTPPAMDPTPPTAETDDDVLVLDRTMLVSAPEEQPPIQESLPGGEAGLVETNETVDELTAETADERVLAPIAPPIEEPAAAAEHKPSVNPAPAIPAIVHLDPPSMPESGLLAPETAAAAASSVDDLRRMLAVSRSTQTHRGGPTIEDLVREEIRPLLKVWLDSHLPGLVERQVRAEIERLVGRAVS